MTTIQILSCTIVYILIGLASAAALIASSDYKSWAHSNIVRYRGVPGLPNMTAWKKFVIGVAICWFFAWPLLGAFQLLVTFLTWGGKGLYVISIGPLKRAANRMFDSVHAEGG